MHLISVYGLSISDAALPCWKDQVKRAAGLAASARWRAHVLSMPSLAAAYPGSDGLGMAAYLRMGPFTGRQLVAQARLNVLPLELCPGAGPAGTCPMCLCPAPDSRFHLLLACPSLTKVRNAHVHAISELHPMCPLPPLPRMSLLLNSPRDRASVPASLAQSTRAQQLGMYLRDIFYASQAHLGTPPIPSMLPHV